MTPHSVALFDARPFFEKALIYGVQHGILDRTRLNAICADAPKGMVQIARYFGTEFLRPELEKARDRMVNLVSLYLEHSCDGDLQRAAESLRDNSFLSRSKGGSDMLKALIAMPQNSHFGMHDVTGFTDEHIPLLAKWSLRTLSEYQAELSLRRQAGLLVDGALWFARELGEDLSDLQAAGKDAEAVIRTGLLALSNRRKDMPDWPGFEKMIQGLRKKHAGQSPTSYDAPTLALPKNLPETLKPTVEWVRESVISDMPKILDAQLPIRKLFDRTPAFIGRYFWLEDALAEIDHFERATSLAWDKATGGHSDDSSLLTLFLCLATGSKPKTLLTDKAARGIVRKVQKAGLQPELASHFIHSHAPHHIQADYARLWESFVEQAAPVLASDFDGALNDAMTLLRNECNISQ